MEKNLKNKTIDQLEEIVLKMSQKKYLAKYIFNFIHAKDATDIRQISPLSKASQEKLIEAGFYISQLKVIKKLTDPDGTIKYLFELEDGSRIETVLLFISNRKTICLSTQVGCAMNCSFCATAKMEFKRNLSAAEIVDQLNVTQKDIGKIRNVVFMGMGEPLKNYDAVMKAVRILTDHNGKNLGVRHLTISTCGIIPGIEKLACEKIFPRLAVSLNATNDSLRTKLMGINKKYPLKTLSEAIRLYNIKTKRRVTFEYVLISGVNDSDSDAQQLVKLLKPLKCNVNLIEYNTHPGCKLKAASKERLGRFSEILYHAGVETTVRFKMGQTIKAAGNLFKAYNYSTIHTGNKLISKKKT